MVEEQEEHVDTTVASYEHESVSEAVFCTPLTVKEKVAGVVPGVHSHGEDVAASGLAAHWSYEAKEQPAPAKVRAELAAKLPETSGIKPKKRKMKRKAKR